jgi:hypothetical protein
MLALMLTACGAVALAADTRTAQLQSAPVRTAPSEMKPALPLDQQVAVLQRQVAVLQSQVNALLSVVRMTDTGVAGQGLAVVIAGHSIEIRSDMNTALRSGTSLTFTSSAGMMLTSSAPLDLRGPMIRLNNGSKPIATAGSTVQVQPTGTGQVVTGSTTVFTD